MLSSTPGPQARPAGHRSIADAATWMQGAAALGVASFGLASAGTLLWFIDHDWHVRRAAYIVITQHWYRLGRPETLWVLGLAFVNSALLAWILRRGDPGKRIVLVLCFLAFVIAGFYEYFLPDPHQFTPNTPGSYGGVDAVWPSLAVGLQLALLGAYALIRTIRSREADRIRVVRNAVVALLLSGMGGILGWYGLIQRTNLG